MKKIPFSVEDITESGLTSGNAFVVQRTREMLRSCRNVVLVAPKGWQLQELMYKMGQTLESENENTRVCYLDLKLVFSREVFEQEFFRAISTLIRPDDRYRPRQGNGQSFLNLPGRFAAGTQSRVIFFIKNFHHILRFDRDKELQKSLKWHWRNQKNCAFCLFAEQFQPYTELFHQPDSPFIKFGKFYQLKKIDPGDVTVYIHSGFENSGKTINSELVRLITRVTDFHPFYIKILAREVWLRTRDDCTGEIISTSLENLLDLFSLHFQKITENLTKKQLFFLKAMLSGESQLTSEKTVSQYKLGSSAHAIKVRQSLEKKEIVLSDRWETWFNDPFYRIWLKSRYFDLPDPL